MAHSELYFGDISTPSPFFSDANIVSAPGTMSVDLVANQLSIDTFDISVITATPSDVTGIAYGTPCWYFFDGSLIGKFFFKKAIRISKTVYKLTIMSAVGLLDNMSDPGGVFEAQSDTFLSVVSGIIGGSPGALADGLYPVTGGVFDCYVEAQVSILPIGGWLKYSTKRKNLHDLLFAESVSMTKADDGTPLFTFLYNQQTPTQIPDNKIYINGTVNYEDAATAVEVTEHTYLNLGNADELVTLFDGSAEGTVTNALVLFDEPCHDLTATNLTISSSNANYAIVTGSGTLTGRKYTHSQKVVRREVLNPQGRTNEISVSDVTLVNPLNSANVADRLLAFYSAANTIDMDVVKDAVNPQCGRQYAFTDPFGDSKTGFVTKMTLHPSNILRANCHIITDYTPTGQGNNYSQAQLFTAGDITVPEDIDKMRLVLIAGGSGGSPGSNGSNGGAPTLTNYSGGYYRGYDMSTALGGAGGAGGAGGQPGKVLTVDLTGLTPGDTITVTYGTGGASGASGTDTTITYNGVTYTTANGSVLPQGIINLFTGDIYGKPGSTGISGGNGGDGKDTTSTPGKSGQSVTVNGVTYAGGLGSQANATDSDHYRIYAQTAGGGGAAYGKKGGNAPPQNTSDYSVKGGNGANASAPSQAQPGNGGSGGNGGGGGGSAGLSRFWLEPSWGTAQGGTGGTGSQGGQGGNGAILAYY